MKDDFSEDNLNTFRAELVLLCAKYFGDIDSPYDIKNIFEDYCHDDTFHPFCVDEEGNTLNMIEEAKKIVKCDIDGE